MATATTNGARSRRRSSRQPSRQPISRFRPTSGEADRFEAYMRRGENVMLTGPTGCGKTTLVQDWAERHELELITVVGSADLTVTNLLGRFHWAADHEVFHDGPLTRAVKEGKPFYFDEIGNVTEDVLKAAYGLLDHRRELEIAMIPAKFRAAPGFRFIGNYNPNYGNGGRSLTPAFRQRCGVFLAISYLPADKEQSLLVDDTGISDEDAEFLVRVGTITREQFKGVLAEGAGTRLLLTAARSLRDGISREDVVLDSVLRPLTDHEGTQESIAQALQSAGLYSIDHLRELQIVKTRQLSQPLSDDAFFDAEEREEQGEGFVREPSESTDQGDNF